MQYFAGELISGKDILFADDGEGFEVADKAETGNGLKNMKSRAKEINAILEISSPKMPDTCIELSVPV